MARCIDTSPFWLIHWAIRSVEIPVLHRAREFGKSKYGAERYLRGFFDLLTVKLLTQYSRSPLYLFGRVGLYSTILGFYHQPISCYLKDIHGRASLKSPASLLGNTLDLGRFTVYFYGLNFRAYRK